ncbi:MAG: hypothetical protein IPF83_06100 [Rhodanobacteraceae bacterium]|nr:hypothetical protein [Rhodanobacteraceae bacterium]
MFSVPLHRARLSVLGSLALCVAPAALAATIQVDNIGGCDLGEAIIAANDDSVFGGCSAGNGDDIIQLPATAHSPVMPLPLITSNLTIRGAAIGTSAVDCAGGGQPFVIGDNDAAPPTVVLSRFGISSCGFQAGSGTHGGGGGAGMGGAVFVYNAEVTFDRVVFSNNTVRGGNGSSSSSTQSGGGGGMHGAGGLAATNSVAALGFGSGGGGGGTQSPA